METKLMIRNIEHNYAHPIPRVKEKLCAKIDWSGIEFGALLVMALGKPVRRGRVGGRIGFSKCRCGSTKRGETRWKRKYYPR
jgi:hypothetical protein